MGNQFGKQTESYLLMKIVLLAIMLALTVVLAKSPLSADSRHAGLATVGAVTFGLYIFVRSREGDFDPLLKKIGIGIVLGLLASAIFLWGIV
jgi:hypothetical protein